MGKVYFVFEGTCSHSLIHWICIEKCANINFNIKLHGDVCLYTSQYESNRWESESMCH